MTPEPLPRYFGPNDFYWLERGMLGGCGQPGLLRALDLDLGALFRVGVRYIVTLTEERAPEAERIRQLGMESYYCPIPDRAPPTTAQAIDLCQRVEAAMAAGKPAVYHCRAGKGRTGTLIAAQMIWDGFTADHAIGQARMSRNSWIESPEQEAFLHDFAHYLSNTPDIPAHRTGQFQRKPLPHA